MCELLLAELQRSAALKRLPCRAASVRHHLSLTHIRVKDVDLLMCAVEIAGHHHWLGGFQGLNRERSTNTGLTLRSGGEEVDCLGLSTSLKSLQSALQRTVLQTRRRRRRRRRRMRKRKRSRWRDWFFVGKISRSLDRSLLLTVTHYAAPSAESRPGTPWFWLEGQRFFQHLII